MRLIRVLKLYRVNYHLRRLLREQPFQLRRVLSPCVELLDQALDFRRVGRVSGERDHGYDAVTILDGDGSRVRGRSWEVGESDSLMPKVSSRGSRERRK